MSISGKPTNEEIAQSIENMIRYFDAQNDLMAQKLDTVRKQHRIEVVLYMITLIAIVAAVVGVAII